MWSIEDGLETAEVRVPADHDRPSLGEMTLRVSRIGEGPPLLFLAGGPGESGRAALRAPHYAPALKHLARSRTVYLLDQRGVDLSLAPIVWTPVALRDPDAMLACLADQARRTALPFPAPCFTAWQSARDLEHLLDGLKVKQTDLLAYSYGTHLAMAMLKAAPERIGSVVMCGFEGPDQTLKLPANVDLHLRRLAELARDQGVDEDLLGRMAHVHARLDFAPIDLGGVEAGRFGLQWMVSTWIGIRERLVKVPVLYASLDRGETELAAASLRSFMRMLDRRPPVYYLKDAASGASELRLQEICASSDPLGGFINFPFPQVRDAWGQVDLGDGFRAPLAVPHPMLVLLGSLDGFTPPTNFADARPHLPGATARIVENAAHLDLLAAPGVAEAVAAFLQDPAQPVDGGWTAPVPQFQPLLPQA